MLNDKFQKLLTLFSQITEGKHVNLEDMMQTSLQFFEELQHDFKDASPEEKQQLMQAINQMYGKLLTETRHLTDKIGLNEEQLLTQVDNPKNFTPEQWEHLQEAKAKLQDSTKNLTKMIRDLAPKDESDKQPPSPPSDDKKIHKLPRRDEWLKS